MALPLPDKPSIAVLPFNNFSTDIQQGYFADGMTEDLITDLSNVSGLFVIARNSSWTYKDKPTKVQQVAEELGVRYVLEGSVRREGDQVRINAQLVDALNGRHLWAERYDGPAGQVFALQDKVIRQIVGYFPNLKVIFLARDPVERLWSHLSMEVRYHQIEAFDVTDIDEVNRNVLRRGMLLRSYPSAVVARWKRYVHPDRFRIYFFDDLQRNPTELRRSILDFLGADPDKSGSRVTTDYNSWARMERLLLTDKVRSHLAQFFKKELKTCAALLGGPARDWPARYGFSLLLFLWDLLDDLDLFSWLDWIG